MSDLPATNDASYAIQMDEKDSLKHFRTRFHIPAKNDKHVLYFAGNSLGLQPDSSEKYVAEELDVWKNIAVDGHIQGRRPWLYYHKFSKKTLSELCGADESEVVAMNSLTVNLHLLLISFYRPDPVRNKIIMEKGAFPSDQYMVETQVRFHGYDPGNTVITVDPRPGEYRIDSSQIQKKIKEIGEELALVLFSGIQYLTGQYFDIGRITQSAHEVGAIAGFDLAHAIGNLPLKLSDNNVDFAAWCSYKYLNSGPGNTGGVYVNQKHGNDPSLHRFGGWWGYDEEMRFKMEPGFSPMKGADGWQLSNVNVLSGAAHLASLEIFSEAGIDNLRQKSMHLTRFLEIVINDISEGLISIITPANPEERGCQLSMVLNDYDGKSLFDFLSSKGVAIDWREPDVIRIAPVPLYNSFMDVYQFGLILKEGLALLRS